MTLREVLNNVKYGEMTDEELLDLEVKVVTEANSGTYKVNCGIKSVDVKQEMRYGSTQHRLIPAEKKGMPYILLETTMIP